MEPFRTVIGPAAPLRRDNVDTDALIPSPEIRPMSRDGFGPSLFARWRYQGSGREENPDFVLNQPPYRNAPILISGANFGCGSSREMAVWALLQFGFRVVVAKGFGAIFRANCLRNGLLPVVLSPEEVDELTQQAEGPGAVVTVDLESRTVTGPDGRARPFALDDRERERLLLGLDEIDLTLRHGPAIQAFVERDRGSRPWAHLDRG